MVSKTNSSREKGLDNLLLETINDVLGNVFGKKAKKIILQTMERNFLEWDEALMRAQVFENVLKEIIGESSIIIEDLILETIYSKLGLEIEWKKGHRFSDYIRELIKTCGCKD